MPIASEIEPGLPKLRVFLSYAREDSEIAERLFAALKERGYDPDSNAAPGDPTNEQPGISAQDAWWRRIEQMIAAADIAVFLVSPGSAASQVCDQEIAFALSLGKRVIMVKIKPVDFASAPPLLAERNVKIDFTEAGPGFEAALDELSVNLDRDVVWRRQGAALHTKAAEWLQAERADGLLLRKAAIDEAERWAARRPRSEPEPGDLLLEFLDASRAKEQRDEDRERRFIQRGFAQPVRTALDEGDGHKALRTMAAAAVLSRDPQFELEAETDEPHRAALTRAGARAHAHAPLMTLKGHQRSVSVCVFSSDGTRALTGSDDGTARLWDAVSGAELAGFEGHTGEITSVAFAPDGTRALTGSGDRTARLWDAAGGAELARLEGHTGEITSVAFAPDGTRALTGSKDKTARLWGAGSGAELVRLEGHTGWISSVAFSPDGTRALTGSDDRRARLWDAASGAELARLGGQTGSIRSVAFSPDGTRALTGSDDGTARLWDAVSGAELARFEGHTGEITSVAFSPDGRRALTGSADRTARLWDATSGAALARLDGHASEIWSVAFSPDGRRALTSSRDKTARLWDAAGGAEVARLDGHADAIWSVAFSPDGSRALTGSSDKTARLWDISRSAVTAADFPLAITALLDCGNGWLSEGDKADLLMRDAPEDLFGAMKAGLTPEQLARLPVVSKALRAPLHPNCYLAPSQREPAGEGQQPAPAEEQAVDDATTEPETRQPVAEAQPSAASEAPPPEPVLAAEAPAAAAPQWSSFWRGLFLGAALAGGLVLLAMRFLGRGCPKQTAPSPPRAASDHEGGPDAAATARLNDPPGYEIEKPVLDDALQHPCHGRCASSRRSSSRASKSPPAACAAIGFAASLHYEPPRCLLLFHGLFFSRFEASDELGAAHILSGLMVAPSLKGVSGMPLRTRRITSACGACRASPQERAASPSSGALGWRTLRRRRSGRSVRPCPRANRGRIPHGGAAHTRTGSRPYAF